MKTIRIVVAPDGQTTLQTRGFAGQACRESSRLLERALGVRLSDHPTAEARQAGRTEESEHEHA